MGRKPNLTLGEMHYKALALLAEGNLTYGEIAKECGWSADYLFDLRNGNTEKAGYIATEFAKETKLIETKQEQRTQDLLKKNMASAQSLIERILTEFAERKSLTREEKKLISTLTNCLSNCQPSVSIKNTQFNYVKGLSPEELMHEFKRLKGITESSFERRGVSEALEGRSGELS